MGISSFLKLVSGSGAAEWRGGDVFDTRATGQATVWAS